MWWIKFFHSERQASNSGIFPLILSKAFSSGKRSTQTISCLCVCENKRSSPLESPGLYQGAESAPQSARDPNPVASIRTKLAQFPAHTRIIPGCGKRAAIRT